MRSLKHPLHLFAFIFFLGCVVVSYLRLHFSVDFYDESHYVAMAEGFTKGLRPFYDENTITQTGALILMPFVKFYLGLVGSNTGIILFVRHLFWIYNLIFAISFIRLSKKLGISEMGYCCGALLISFIPLGLPSISYNTIGFMGILAAQFFLLKYLLDKPSLKLLGLGVLALNIAAYAYPPLSILLFLYLVLCLHLFKFDKESQRGIQLLAVLLPCFLGLSVVVFTLHFIGQEQITAILNFYRSMDIYSRDDKINEFFSKIIKSKNELATVFSITLAFLFSYRTKYWALFITFVAFVTEIFFGGAHFNTFLANFCFVFFISFFFANKKNFSQIDVSTKNTASIVFVFLVTLVAGLSYSFSSSNGILNIVLGLVPGSVCLFFILYFFVQDRIKRYLLILIVTFFTSIQMIEYKNFYNDGPFELMTEKFQDGPFQGIYSQASKVDFANELSLDLQIFEKANDRILFFDTLPAGYLLSQLKPLTPSLFILNPEGWIKYDRKLLRDYFKTNDLPELVVHVLKIPQASGSFYQDIQNPQDSFSDLFVNNECYNKIKEVKNYIIYRINKDCPK